ncbi:MAG: hypothetical protein LBG07_05185 [Treponema sp.]|jgi:hypothetical protein|nr:hypothetical protein [Treponema sp.]
MGDITSQEFFIPPDSPSGQTGQEKNRIAAVINTPAPLRVRIIVNPVPGIVNKKNAKKSIIKIIFLQFGFLYGLKYPAAKTIVYKMVLGFV